MGRALAARGYCALALDLAGNGPNSRLPEGRPDQTDEHKFRDFDNMTVRDMGTYHAVTTWPWQQRV